MPNWLSTQQEQTIADLRDKVRPYDGYVTVNPFGGWNNLKEGDFPVRIQISFATIEAARFTLMPDGTRL